MSVTFPQGSVNFKFGVLFAKDGQLTDDEMFSNGIKYKLPPPAPPAPRSIFWTPFVCFFPSVAEMGSESFDKFLKLLGDSITLQGWAGYRGGLDTKSEKCQNKTFLPPSKTVYNLS